MDCLVFVISCQKKFAPFDIAKCRDTFFFTKEEAEAECERMNKEIRKSYHVEELIVARKIDTKYNDYKDG